MRWGISYNHSFWSKICSSRHSVLKLWIVASNVVLEVLLIHRSISLNLTQLTSCDSFESWRLSKIFINCPLSRVTRTTLEEFLLCPSLSHRIIFTLWGTSCLILRICFVSHLDRGNEKFGSFDLCLNINLVHTIHQYCLLPRTVYRRCVGPRRSNRHLSRDSLLVLYWFC